MVSYPSSSLEDCPTNVVSWTEFNNISWTCLTSPKPVENVRNCPILKAYNECQKHKIYSYWRRKPGPSQTFIGGKFKPRSPAINGKEPKELWIFWYDSTEPEIIKDFINKDGLEQDTMATGSFANNGLDYKIRILLYAALHRKIEMGCLAKNYIRFGKWFVQPMNELITPRKSMLPKYMLAFQFSFCIFGNQICISPKFQRQPTLLSISRQHLLQKIRQKVILSPWGLVAYLLPEQSHFDLDNPDPPEAEVEKAPENLLSSFGGFFSTPDENKKQLKDILKKDFENFLFSAAYSEFPTTSTDLPKFLAIEIDGLTTYWPTALMAICIDDLKEDSDDEEPEDEESGDIEFIESLMTSPSTHFPGCRAAQRLMEDALIPPPESERMTLLDCTQKELCLCKLCNILEVPFDSLPSISPATLLNPNTPHSVQTKISEPPSVPPTSIESVHSTSGDMKHLRHPVRPRYAQPQYQQYSHQTELQKDRPKSPKVEAEVEEARRNDPCPTTSWALAPGRVEFPINQSLQVANGDYTKAIANDIYETLPLLQHDTEWDVTEAPQRPISPYTPIDCVTPEYSRSDSEMELEQYQRREKPLGLDPSVREAVASPTEPLSADVEKSSILRTLLDTSDESGSEGPASVYDQRDSRDDDQHPSDNYYGWYRGKRPNMGVNLNIFDYQYKRRRITHIRPVDVDIARIGVPKTTDYFEAGDFPSPPSNYYSKHRPNAQSENPSLLPPDTASMNEQDRIEMQQYETSIERIPNPMITRTSPERNFPPSPGTLTDLFAPAERYPTSVDSDNPTTEAMDIDNSGTVIADAAQSIEQPTAGNSLAEALNQVLNPVTDEDDEVAEGKRRALAYFQKHNPFSIDEEENRKRKEAEIIQELDNSLLPPEEEPVEIFSDAVMADIRETIYERSHPWLSMCYEIHYLIPNPRIYHIEGCTPMIQCKEFYGNIFEDNVMIPPSMFNVIDNRNARDRIPRGPSYVKKTNVKDKVVEPIDLQKAEQQEHIIRSGIVRNQQLQYQQQQQQGYMQQQQQPPSRNAMFASSRQHSFMGNSPQMNGMNQMFNNGIPQTPSPMSTPRYIQPLSNTLTVCGSNTGGSVQMVDTGMGMNNFPPMTSTPNSMMPPINYGNSPQMNRGFMPPPPPYGALMPNGYGQQGGQMMPPPPENLLMNPFETIPPQLGVSSGQQMFEKIQKSIGFVIASLLRDSTFDLHYDAVYDSCPLCSCTESIRTNEYGIYLRIPADVMVADQVQCQANETETSHPSVNRFSAFFMKQGVECFCAFSAVRHRYLCEANSNLFGDDIREATGAAALVETEKPELRWFNPLKSNDWKFIDVFRWYLLGHDLSGYIRSGYYIGECPTIDKYEDFDRLLAPKKEYTVNGIDQGELDFIVSSVIDASVIDHSLINERASRTTQGELTSLIHPWAVQLAEKMPPPNEFESTGFMKKVVSILEETAQRVRMLPNAGAAPTTSIVEGPLTWKCLHRKATKMYKIQIPENEEDTAHTPEPIPNIVVGSEKDLILTTPTVVWAWDRVGLAPYSWPKNILYLAVIPEHSMTTEKSKTFSENSLITEKCRIFLEDLSNVYEKNRLGRHLPLPPKLKDSNSTLNNGLIKIPLQNFNNSNDQKSLVHKLEYFVNQYLQIISRVFGEMECFDKRTFLEAVYRDFYADHHSSAVPTDSTAMPPPPPATSVNSTSSPMPPNDQSFDSPMFNHQQSQSTNSPLPNMGMFDTNNINPRTPDQGSSLNNLPFSDDPLSPTSISNGVDELVINDEDNLSLPHVLVIYIMNPFFFGSANAQEYFSKLVTVKLLKSVNNILASLNLVERPRVQVELIDIRTVFDYAAYSNDPLQECFHPLNQSTFNDPLASVNALRKLAFTVYSQPRQLHVECMRDVLSKSMTRFGPFSQASDILDTLTQSPSSTYRIPTAPFILAPKPTNYEIVNGKLKVKNMDEKVLFVTYCLVKDDFLVVSVTDDRGELCDTKVISISRRTTSKIVSQSNTPPSAASLVVDAIQRLWAYIQGVMSLDTKNWRLVIGRFGKIGHGEFKAWTSILSKKSLQHYNSLLKGREKELQTPGADKNLTSSTSCKTCALNPGFAETPALIAACLVSTEADVYFKVFPEYTTADPKLKGTKILPNDYSITHIMVFPTSPAISNDADAGMIEDKDDDDFFFDAGGDDNAGLDLDGVDIDMTELGEVTSATSTIPNQPIAMGFLISTAPALDVPDWFWSQCPNAKNETPVHLRSALHISVPHVQQSDEMMLAMTENHPLESNKTEEVLTYILQTYNELSWLNVDIITGQRKSCLPIHIQKLLILYNSMNTTFY